MHKAGEERVDKGHGLGQSAEIFAHYQRAEAFFGRRLQGLAVVADKGRFVAPVVGVGAVDGGAHFGEDGDIGFAEGVY